MSSVGTNHSALGRGRRASAPLREQVPASDEDDESCCLAGSSSSYSSSSGAACASSLDDGNFRGEDAEETSVVAPDGTLVSVWYRGVDRKLAHGSKEWRKAKRLADNRASAARSRVLARFKTEDMGKQLADLQAAHAALLAENAALRADVDAYRTRVCELEALLAVGGGGGDDERGSDMPTRTASTDAARSSAALLLPVDAMCSGAFIAGGVVDDAVALPSASSEVDALLARDTSLGGAWLAAAAPPAPPQSASHALNTYGSEDDLLLNSDLLGEGYGSATTDTDAGEREVASALDSSCASGAMSDSTLSPEALRAMPVPMPYASLSPALTDSDIASTDGADESIFSMLPPATVYRSSSSSSSGGGGGVGALTRVTPSAAAVAPASATNMFSSFFLARDYSFSAFFGSPRGSGGSEAECSLLSPGGQTVPLPTASATLTPALFRSTSVMSQPDAAVLSSPVGVGTKRRAYALPSGRADAGHEASDESDAYRPPPPTKRARGVGERPTAWRMASSVPGSVAVALLCCVAVISMGMEDSMEGATGGDESGVGLWAIPSLSPRALFSVASRHTAQPASATHGVEVVGYTVSDVVDGVSPSSVLIPWEALYAALAAYQSACLWGAGALTAAAHASFEELVGVTFRLLLAAAVVYTFVTRAQGGAVFGWRNQFSRHATR